MPVSGNPVEGVSRNPIDRASVYFAAGLVSGCGALMFNVMPVFVGAMAKSLGYGEARLGDMVAVFNVGFTVAALSAFSWVRAFDWRALSLSGVLLAALSLGAMALIADPVGLAVLMGSTGVGMGALYALILAVLGDSNNPNRAFGIKLGLETLPGAALLFLLPTLIFPIYGFAGVAIGMTAVVVGLGIFSWLLPRSGVKGAAFEASEEVCAGSSAGFAPGASAAKPLSGSFAWLPVIGLLSSLLFFTGISASWAFLELLAQTNGLGADEVGTALGVAFIICGLGGFAAAAIGDRFGQLPPMLGIIAINIAGLALLGDFQTIAGYATGACLFLFSVNFTLAYTFGLTAHVDESGKLVVLSAACLSVGAIVGPSIAGRLIETIGYGTMLTFSALCSVASLLFYLLLMQTRRKRKLAPQ